MRCDVMRVLTGSDRRAATAAVGRALPVELEAMIVAEWDASSTTNRLRELWERQCGEFMELFRRRWGARRAERIGERRDVLIEMFLARNGVGNRAERTDVDAESGDVNKTWTD